jgi:hypothetical protein
MRADSASDKWLALSSIVLAAAIEAPSAGGGIAANFVTLTTELAA